MQLSPPTPPPGRATWQVSGSGRCNLLDGTQAHKGLTKPPASALRTGSLEPLSQARLAQEQQASPWAYLPTSSAEECRDPGSTKYRLC